MTNHLKGLGLRGPNEVDVGVDDPVEREGMISTSPALACLGDEFEQHRRHVVVSLTSPVVITMPVIHRSWSLSSTDFPVHPDGRDRPTGPDELGGYLEGRRAPPTASTVTSTAVPMLPLPKMVTFVLSLLLARLGVRGDRLDDVV